MSNAEIEEVADRILVGQDAAAVVIVIIPKQVSLADAVVAVDRDATLVGLSKKLEALADGIAEGLAAAVNRGPCQSFPA